LLLEIVNYLNIIRLSRGAKVNTPEILDFFFKKYSSLHNVHYRKLGNIYKFTVRLNKKQPPDILVKAVFILE